MDDKRFDSLTRMLGRGASRRSILKGLLGIGGGAVTRAVVEESAEARTLSLTRIPPPPPPACPSGQQLCGGTTSAHCCPTGRCFDGLCCANTSTSRCGPTCCPSGQCTSDGECCPTGLSPCGSICCLAGTCAREGATDICCAGTLEFPERAPCGLDCCDTPLQCCDGECCPADSFCLARVFGETAVFEEETCCTLSQLCDGQCCSGTCYDDEIDRSSEREDISLPGSLCCPAGDGFTFCPGEGHLTGIGACCSGDTPNCCHSTHGQPFCAGEGDCCTDDDCGDCEFCRLGVCRSFCSDPESICCNDQCVDGPCCDDQGCVDTGAGDAACVTCYHFENEFGQPASSCVLLGTEETELQCGDGGLCCYGQCLENGGACSQPCNGAGVQCASQAECCPGLLCGNSGTCEIVCNGGGESCAVSPCCDGFACNEQKVCVVPCKESAEPCQSQAECCPGLLCGNSGTCEIVCNGGGESCAVSPCCDGFACNEQQICVVQSCVPDCTGMQCGSDGCSGSCGVCDEFPNSFCDETTGQCECTPNTCPPLVTSIGPDGCGNTLVCPGCTSTADCVNWGFSDHFQCITCASGWCVPSGTTCELGAYVCSCVDGFCNFGFDICD